MPHLLTQYLDLDRPLQEDESLQTKQILFDLFGFLVTGFAVVGLMDGEGTRVSWSCGYNDLQVSVMVNWPGLPQRSYRFRHSFWSSQNASNTLADVLIERN
ncbi:uncharacterized protein EV154DRAFT_488027 [Mucor mucedo]|uniref:uncharacterized protein n=1 Tax=Mucor mucedo TaxID=29922 RepID=UPI00221E8789|nr:uncharacterized protein EV154DRAFT_488027 [Mucor mucedo]KAI7869271.1 hypothetical protein EV154DRAFT_488027 [Mucor mucedo]